MRRTLALAAVTVVTGLTMLASPLTGVAYADAAIDPTGYLHWVEGHLAPSDLVEEGLGASRDAEIVEVCTATGIGVAACTAGGLAAGYAISHWGASVWHWAFGSSHPAPPAAGDTQGCYHNSGTAGLCASEAAFSTDRLHICAYPYSACTTHWRILGGSIECFDGTTATFPTDAPGTFRTLFQLGVTPCSTHGGFKNGTITSDVGTGTWRYDGTYAASPGAGGLTVTGHCYDPVSGAPAGDVSGSSSWSGSDTTIPDTTLPACGPGDALGGVDVTGTGSASGVNATTTGYPPDVLGGPGTTLGPVTDTDPSIPDACVAQDAQCYTTWQNQVHGHWVDVDTADVPDNYAEDYRCELKTATGSDVTTMPVTACPTPGAPDDTTDTGTGEPKDGDIHIDGMVATSCWPHGWSMLYNPVDWVMKPAECAIVHTLEPDAAHMAKVNDLASEVESRQPIASLKAAYVWVDTAFSGIESGSCSLGWTVHFPSPIGDVSILSCDNPIVGILRSYRSLFEAVVYVAFFAPLAWWAWRTYAPGSTGSA
jgi:hypothetical protein